MSLKLAFSSGTEVVPASTIYGFESKGTASTKAESDIYGNQVAIIPEIKTSDQMWTVGAGYLTAAQTKVCTAAYEGHTELTLTDERGNTFTVIIVEYPNIERNKTADGDVVYVVKMTLGIAPTSWTIPVVSLTGPRQFGR